MLSDMKIRHVVMTRLDDELKERMHSKAQRLKMSDAGYLRHLIEKDTRPRAPRKRNEDTSNGSAQLPNP